MKFLKETESMSFKSCSDENFIKVYNHYSFENNVSLSDRFHPDHKPVILKKETDKQFLVLRNTVGKPGYMHTAKVQLFKEMENGNMKLTVVYNIKYSGLLIVMVSSSVLLFYLNLLEFTFFKSFILGFVFWPIIFVIISIISYKIELLRFKDFYFLFCNKLRNCSKEK